MNRIVVLLLISLGLGSCQSSSFNWDKATIAVSEVRVNTMFGDTIPFEEPEVYTSVLSGQDAVFLAGFVDRLVQKANGVTRRHGVDATFKSVSSFSQNPVYLQFPKSNEPSLLMLLPYYQDIDVTNASIFKLLTRAIEADSLMEMDFYFFGAYDATFLEVEVRGYSAEQQFSWVFRQRVGAIEDRPRPRPLSFLDGQERLYLELLQQFEDAFLLRLAEQCKSS